MFKELFTEGLNPDWERGSSSKMTVVKTPKYIVRYDLNGEDSFIMVDNKKTYKTELEIYDNEKEIRKLLKKYKVKV
jgi:hypothetical protein